MWRVAPSLDFCVHHFYRGCPILAFIARLGTIRHYCRRDPSFERAVTGSWSPVMRSLRRPHFEIYLPIQRRWHEIRRTRSPAFF